MKAFPSTDLFRKNVKTRHCHQVLLKTLISLILKESNLKNQEKQKSPACLVIGKAIAFNAKKLSTVNLETKPRHSLEREPPLPVDTGWNIHGLTRSKHLINQLHHQGIWISYERDLQLEDWIAKAICIRVVTRTELYPLSALKEVCLPLVLWTTWTIIPVQLHHKALSMVLVLVCSNFHPQTSRVNVDRQLRLLLWRACCAP